MRTALSSPVAAFSPAQHDATADVAVASRLEWMFATGLILSIALAALTMGAGMLLGV